MENHMEHNHQSGSVSVVDQVINGIINQIISGELKPGDKLPTEPELSAQFGASRNSVREAVKILQGYGVIYIKRADGTYVSESYNSRMLDPVLFSLILQKNSRNDFVGLREMIDIGVLNVIIQRKDVAAFLPRIYMTFGEMSAELHSDAPDVNKVLELDNRFHFEIAAAAQNPMIETIVEYINQLTLPSRTEATRKAIEKGNIDNFIDLHRQLISIIENRKVGEIVKAVNDHYIYWK